MRNRLFQLGVLAVGVCSLLAFGITASGSSPDKVTFTRDVAPILYNRCVECHRAGEVAPMALITYNQTRPWAKSIKQKVVDRSMPPWLASPENAHFKNERRLSQKEIETIIAWVDAGAPKGSDEDLPAPPRFEQGWAIGKPDAILSLDQEIAVPAEGVIPYKYFTVQTNFAEDKWVQAAEIRPGNPKVVHHVIVYVQEPGATSAQPSEGRGGRGVKLSGYAPGEQPKVFPTGTARLIKKGSKLTFQMHYTPTGEATTDRSYIGLVFSKSPVHKIALTGTATNARFVIPPGDGNYEVRSSWTAPDDVRILDLMPHMHVRGKDFTYTAVYPDGRSEVVLRVPRYDFNWQLLYQFRDPLFLPKGARLDCVAHFDNSARNKYNPDPSKEVRWGDQTWEEMMIGWFDYVLEKENLAERASNR
ncbi:MAG TPA: thiol-disulfide isomerase [Blastocatellia bacterium]|nr:thiol-disulfide isomerase [Blastocatellia bacterium]